MNKHQVCSVAYKAFQVLPVAQFTTLHVRRGPVLARLACAIAGAFLPPVNSKSINSEHSIECRGVCNDTIEPGTQ